MEKILVINVKQSLRQIRKRIDALERPQNTHKPHEIEHILEALDYVIEVVN